MVRRLIFRCGSVFYVLVLALNFCKAFHDLSRVLMRACYAYIELVVWCGWTGKIRCKFPMDSNLHSLPDQFATLKAKSLTYDIVVDHYLTMI